MFTLGGHVFPSSNGGIWMSTPTCEQVYLLMCQHSVEAKGVGGPPLLVLCTFNSHMF
jgi:hypothetical protein